MVEMLGEKKMALEEKVAELEEAVSDLEALQVRSVLVLCVLQKTIIITINIL